MQSEAMGEIWRYRELLYFFAWRDLKVRYKQAALGATWAIVQPLFTMVTFTVFFGKLAGISSGSTPYPLFSYSALVLWTYFSFSLGHIGNSLVNNSNLITKVYFPRLLLPAAAALGGVIDIFIGSLLIVALMAYYHVVPGFGVLLVPIFVFEMIVLVIGLGMIFAALNVRFRDVKYAIPFVVQLGLFISPVIYPVTFVPEKYRALLALNPMTGIIEGFRTALFGDRSFDWHAIGISWLVTLLFFGLGALYFRRTERDFADIV